MYAAGGRVINYNLSMWLCVRYNLYHAWYCKGGPGSLTSALIYGPWLLAIPLSQQTLTFD